MTIDTKLKDFYLDWLTNIVMPDNTGQYTKVLIALLRIDFVPYYEEDVNRGKDGLDLRDTFASALNIDSYTMEQEFGSPPCSMLEMMVALSIRMENTMNDDEHGDRTAIWFMVMINSLGLGSMIDNNFNQTRFDFIMNRFFSKQYMPNGDGGLFKVRNYQGDIRDLEIWYQMHCYANELDNSEEHYVI